MVKMYSRVLFGPQTEWNYALFKKVDSTGDNCVQTKKQNKNKKETKLRKTSTVDPNFAVHVKSNCNF